MIPASFGFTLALFYRKSKQPFVKIKDCVAERKGKVILEVSCHYRRVAFGEELPLDEASAELTENDQKIPQQIIGSQRKERSYRQTLVKKT